MENGNEILAALLEEDCAPSFQEEVVNGVMRSLERDVIGVDPAGILPASSCSNCYLQSDSAHSVTSSSSLVSDSDDQVLNGIGRECGEEEQEQIINELGYLMEASDEELGLSPQVSLEGELDLGVEDLVDFEPLDLLGGEIEWVPYL